MLCAINLHNIHTTYGCEIRKDTNLQEHTQLYSCAGNYSGMKLHDYHYYKCRHFVKVGVARHISH